MTNHTNNEQLSALWRALLFIQNNLHEDLSLEQIATVAGFSAYHFHRLFKTFTGESVKSYIRRLRLENAAFRLKTQKEQIIDIAFDSGFYTHETFTRAFNKKFGINPSEYKKEKKAFSDSYLKNIKQVYFKKRHCIFKRYIGPYENSGIPTDNKSLWHSLIGYLPSNMKDITKLELFGISYDDPSITEHKNIRYDACISVPDNFSQTETSLILKEGFYISADHIGPFNELTKSYHYLIYNWLALYNYSIDENIAPFEQFHISKRDRYHKIDCITIFIPIKK